MHSLFRYYTTFRRYSTRFTERLIDNIQSITEIKFTEDIDSHNESKASPSKERQVKQICQAMLDRIPSVYNKFMVIERLEALGNLRPIVIFLRQEIQRMTILLEVTHLVLSDLIQAIDGKIIMNANLREAMEAIFNAKVPSMFLRVRF